MKRLRIIEPGYRKLNRRFFRRSVICGILLEGVLASLYFAFPGVAGGGFASGSTLGFCILAPHLPFVLAGWWLGGPACGVAFGIIGLAVVWTLLFWHTFTTWEARKASQGVSAAESGRREDCPPGANTT